MKILSIDTSTRGCSVAVHDSGALLASYDLFADKSSSAMLTSLMESAVKHAGATLADLDAIAVAKGPGSYTGLRVGVSTAKGLCYALDKPLLVINTLEAMAWQVIPFHSSDLLFCPMIDARRMEVYASIFDAEGKVVSPTEAVIVDENSFHSFLANGKVVFFGDGASKCIKVLGQNKNAVFLKADIRPSAMTVGALAKDAYAAGNFVNVASFEPYYLKDFMSPPAKKQPVSAS
ncbi:tRNA (adenosine(37)-N6)-threonylcarbamoyltransferase complex dimerization subunit type 1 TsaB [Dyadobacter luteus]|uniref:tRNA (Adenosine(37)-N6)-threonylcarbamoyltransferase complex dimerization subunit type 1 TsaB n=1 Tax=Dyadobacter luteus TaxID=2259619 RepID=A0A3D8Y4F5_9BACT|nr:tRNA (adenosine(37)-N6)-threonylcarbamoyltransferase complex dimerization subunit type 1 TsaB [Dyadobacter luteus]REA57262.1 tRNA (adenosine(37)-N6)-threonylcarbamoyltransferase complex dimerization subunit type 1 TsaB [Dyadobacter luteus]